MTSTILWQCSEFFSLLEFSVMVHADAARSGLISTATMLLNHNLLIHRPKYRRKHQNLFLHITTKNKLKPILGLFRFIQPKTHPNIILLAPNAAKSGIFELRVFMLAICSETLHTTCRSRLSRAIKST